MKTFFARLKNISRIPTRMMLPVVVVGAFAGGSWVFAQVADVTVQACVKKDGVTRILIPGFTRSECLKDERLVEWNILGPQGQKGDAGEMGAQGLAGMQGIRGEQGTQGLVGPTGATGSQGLVGLSGSNGTNGQNLIVRDAKGNRVGLFLGVNPGVNGLDVVSPSWEIWVDSLGATAIYSSFDGSITPSAPQVRVYYSGTSCTGSAYTTTPLPGVVVVGGNSSNSYKTGNRANIILMSWIRNGNCEPTGGVSGGYELTEVDAHLSGPLTVTRE